MGMGTRLEASNSNKEMLSLAAWMRVVEGGEKWLMGKDLGVGDLYYVEEQAGWGGGGRSSFLDSALLPEQAPLSLKGTRSSEKNHSHPSIALTCF